ncbi:MAG: ZIP family metal transporter, partial [Ktedonobacterales bacterium]
MIAPLLNNALLYAVVSFFSTGVGGLFALRNRGRLRLIMAFTAGVLVGLVVFDLLPEIFRLIREQNITPTWPMVALMLGFLAFYTVEKLTLIHQSGGDGKTTTSSTHPQVGILSALALSGHSFLDGVGIGLA